MTSRFDPQLPAQPLPTETRPAQPAPSTRSGGAAPDPQDGPDEAFAVDEMDLRRRLKRRRRSGVPGFLIAALIAVGLIAALVAVVRQRQQAEPSSTQVASRVPSAPAPSPDAPAGGPAPGPAVTPPVPSAPDPGTTGASSAPTRSNSPPPLAATPAAPRPAAPPPGIIPPLAAAPPAASAVPDRGGAELRPAPPPSPPRSGPSSTEVANLVKRARDLITVGDIGAARLVLERAASTDDGVALFALAETYDPTMLERWRVRGVRPDGDKARAFYLRALERGVSQAQERLAALR